MKFEFYVRSVFMALAFSLGAITVFYGQTTTTTLNATADALVDSYYGTTAYGTTTQLEAGVKISGGVTTIRRSYIQFSGLSSIPQNAIIVSAVLNIQAISEGTDYSSNPIVVSRASSSWTESGVKYSNAPGVYTSDQKTSTTSLVSGIRSINLTDHVQRMVSGGVPKYGWRLSRNNETSATLGSTYYSNNTTTTSYRPTMVVTYYVPYTISAATITHATTTTLADGSIVPTVTNGPTGTATYQWYAYSTSSQAFSIINGATSSSLSSVKYGIYGLKITGTTGDPVYMAFVVGVKCQEVSINFNPGADYMDDVELYQQVGSTVDLWLNYPYSTSMSAQGGGTTYNAFSLLKFRLWVDPGISVTQANLSLKAYLSGDNDPHTTGGGNEVALDKIGVSWYEGLVRWKPSYTTSGEIVIPATTTSVENKSVDIKSMWESWKTNNLTNYGMVFQLKNTPTTNKQMQFYSSDFNVVSSLPSISFKFSLIPVAGTAAAASSNVCTGTTTTLSLSGYSTGSTFQWQSSTNGTTYTNISGATSAAYTTLSTTTVNTYYRCVVTLGTCTSVNSNAVLVTIKPVPTVTVNSPDFCSGSSTTLTAVPSASGGTYSWNTGATTASTSVSPAVTTGYTVSYLYYGCTVNAVSTVTVCQQYVKLERSLTGVNYPMFGNAIKFFYNEEYQPYDSHLTYKVFADNNRVVPVMSTTTSPQSLSYGDNRYKLTISSLASGYYILEVENDKKEKFYLRFYR